VAGQKREILRWLDGNGIDEASVRWFIDKSSGDDLERPAFEELQSAVLTGKIGTIVVWKLDRVSRDLRDGINTLMDWLSNGVRLVSVTQNFDFQGAVGKMVAALLFAVAEMEQEHHRERQAAGIAAAKERGVYKGRQRGTTKSDPSRALALRDRGLTPAEIAAAMSVSSRTVRRYLAAAK
jgi:DNA invertase Pin-like site-specific DNA recombinase